MQPTAVFPNAKLKGITDAAKTHTWWRDVYPRRYHTQHGYVPTDVHAGAMGAIIHVPMPEEYVNDTLAGTALAANILMKENGCQYFWVTADLCAALLATREPEGQINETPWPFRAFTLMIPIGAMRTRTDGDMAWITVARGGRRPDGGIDPDGDDCLFLHGASVGASGAPRDWTSYLRSDKPVEAATGEQRHSIDHMDPETAKEMNRRFGWSVMDMLAAGTVAETEEFDEPETLRAMLRLVMNVAHYLASVPDAVEAGGRGGHTVKRGVTVDEWWYPRWIGRNYTRRVLLTGPPAGTHASPRTHWRRGHWRTQPVGPGRQDRRRLWIEPILVMAAL